jgi:hypothetical protein
MFIALGHNQIPAPFGGAERDLMNTCELDFRLSERCKGGCGPRL